MLLSPEIKKYWPFAALAAGALYVGFARRPASSAAPGVPLAPDLGTANYGAAGPNTASSAYGYLGDPNAFLAALQNIITPATGAPVSTPPAPLPAGTGTPPSGVAVLPGTGYTPAQIAYALAFMTPAQRQAWLAAHPNALTAGT